MAKWTKNNFSPISIKMLWDIDIGLIRQFPKFEKKFQPERYFLAIFVPKKRFLANFWRFLVLYSHFHISIATFTTPTKSVK